jgi:hypothetical protein
MYWLQYGVLICVCLGCTKPRTAQNVAPQPSSSIEKAPYDSAEVAESDAPTIWVFHRTGTRKSIGIEGTETPLCYSGAAGQLFLYEHYYVLTRERDQYEIYAREAREALDSISISSADSVLLKYGDVGEWYEGIIDHFLFTDYGTSSNDHDIDVTDLRTGKTILKVGYLHPVRIDSAYQLHYSEIVGPATKAECPEWDTIVANGDPPHIAEKATFNLKTHHKRMLGERQCFGLQ